MKALNEIYLIVQSEPIHRFRSKFSFKGRTPQFSSYFYKKKKEKISQRLLTHLIVCALCRRLIENRCHPRRSEGLK